MDNVQGKEKYTTTANTGPETIQIKEEGRSNIYITPNDLQNILKKANRRKKLVYRNVRVSLWLKRSAGKLSQVNIKVDSQNAETNRKDEEIEKILKKLPPGTTVKRYIPNETE
ncbi:uncharacterized protein LOC143196975 [Rhynchophorus ferrugineus]|uniref:uncharacterized protein LOC143196975 n=1 Tax=Rhynchophorus ferrugineus TaxID=354439 RepID=UPI003FCD6F37